MTSGLKNVFYCYDLKKKKKNTKLNLNNSTTFDFLDN